MKSVILLLPFLLHLVLTDSIPRLKFLIRDAPRVEFDSEQKWMVAFYDKGLELLYVGGKEVIYILNFQDSEVKQIPIYIHADEDMKEDCVSKFPEAKAECENFIVALQRLNDSAVIACGTNAGEPKCWILSNETGLPKNLTQDEAIDGNNISPPFPSQQSVTIAVEGELYTAMSSIAKKEGLIQRSYKRERKGLKTEDKWLLKPEFVSSALIPGSDDKTREIYFFFSETNVSATLDENPFKARIGRVCQGDEGGLKNLLPDSFTMFLKARLICGSPTKFLLYNKFQDAAMLMSEDSSGGTLYGVFISTWGLTAVCAYSSDRISHAFKNSKLKGYASSLPDPRPGTCTSGTPLRTAMTIIKDYPELEDVLHPNGEQPLCVSDGYDRYMKIAVTRVRAANADIYNIFFLGTEKGKIQKVLHFNNQAFIISELSPFEKEAPVSTLNLDATTGHLYATTMYEVVRLPVADCKQYGDTCRKCVAARDPYCGWDSTNRECSPIPQQPNTVVSDFLQEVERPNTSLCDDMAEPRTMKEEPNVMIMNVNDYVYLPCPVRSYYATYTWRKDNDETYPCTISKDSCTLALGKSDTLNPGVFRCTAMEEGHQEEVTAYRLELNSGRILQSAWIWAVGLLLLVVILPSM